MAIMTPEEEQAWVKVKAAVYVLGGHILAKTGQVRLTCAVDSLPDDEMGLESKTWRSVWNARTWSSRSVPAWCT